MSPEKTIHYCWFGGTPLPRSAEVSIQSWKKYAPGFTVVRWDEHNFDIDCSSWTRAAYNANRFAFVSDYARFKILYEHGGVYMDVGSELIKDISDLVDKSTPFSAIEELSLTVTTGLIVSVDPGNDAIGAVLDAYDKLPFEDSPSFLADHTVNIMFTNEMRKRGYVSENRLQFFDGWTILPSDTFNPVYGFGGYHVKKDTFSIHKSSSSWVEPKYKLKKEIQAKCAPFMGRRLAQIVGRIAGEVKYEGLGEGTKNLILVASTVAKRRLGR